MMPQAAIRSATARFKPCSLLVFSTIHRSRLTTRRHMRRPALWRQNSSTLTAESKVVAYAVAGPKFGNLYADRHTRLRARARWSSRKRLVAGRTRAGRGGPGL